MTEEIKNFCKIYDYSLYAIERVMIYNKEREEEEIFENFEDLEYFIDFHSDEDFRTKKLKDLKREYDLTKIIL